MTGASERWCPSAQPEMAGAVVFGVVTGGVSEPMVGYLEASVSLDEVRPLLDGTEPTRVLRIGAVCEESACAHHDGTSCSLARRVAADLPAVVEVLPRCAIRSRCRWYAEQGGSICRRCPQVVTLDSDRPGAEVVRRVAEPPATARPG
jgi:hypothetical protein